MFDIYGLAAVHLQPKEKMSWDELAAQCEHPSWLWRALSGLIVLVSLAARLRHPQACPDAASDGACGCRVPA